MKITFCNGTMILLLFLSFTVPAMGAHDPAIIYDNPTETRATELQARLQEIQGMDKKELTRGERKQLRHEVREIKKELATMSGGVYLSVGAIILIALLLILLL